MFIDQLYESLSAGGWLLIPIFIVGVIAFFILFRIIEHMGDDLFRPDMRVPLQWFRRSLDSSQPLPSSRWASPGLSVQLMQRLMQLQDHPPAFRRAAMRIELKGVYYRMEKGLYLTSVLASVAPLLGLLGTVDGMVATFSVITRFGNSNPTLLADGIAKALLTTQSGLLVAFPLLLVRNVVEERITQLRSAFERLCTDGIIILETDK